MASDGSMFLGNFTKQMEYALRFVEAAKVAYGIEANQITFTGHSLGGSLAEVAGYTFGSETYTYNPYGVGDVINGNEYQDFLEDELPQITAVRTTDNIHNIVALGGDDPDFITGVASHFFDNYLGEVIYVKDHTGGNSFGYASHGKEDINESIAIYNNMLSLFQGENYNSLTEKLDCIRPKTRQVERLLESLSELGSVNALSGDHVTWSENISNSGLTNLTLNSLAESSTSSLESQAGNLAGMYALLNLNPFTVTGANYSHLNQDGELESASYSEQYIEDRAKFLYYLSHPDATVSNFDPDMDFVDNRLGITREVENGMWSLQDDSQYMFGNLEGEILEGEDESDHLYGMGGNDTLKGHDGEDYIEGGKGRDTKYGRYFLQSGAL